MTNSFMKMLNLKAIEGWVCYTVLRRNSPKEGQDTGVGGLAPVYYTIGSSFRTLTDQRSLLKETD